MSIVVHSNFSICMHAFCEYYKIFHSYVLPFAVMTDNGTILFSYHTYDPIWIWMIHGLFPRIEESFKNINMDMLTPIGVFPSKIDVRYIYSIHTVMTIYKLFWEDPKNLKNKDLIIETVKKTLDSHKLTHFKQKCISILSNILNNYSL